MILQVRRGVLSRECVVHLAACATIMLAYTLSTQSPSSIAKRVLSICGFAARTWQTLTSLGSEPFVTTITTTTTSKAAYPILPLPSPSPTLHSPPLPSPPLPIPTHRLSALPSSPQFPHLTNCPIKPSPTLTSAVPGRALPCPAVTQTHPSPS